MRPEGKARVVRIAAEKVFKVLAHKILGVVDVPLKHDRIGDERTVGLQYANNLHARTDHRHHVRRRESRGGCHMNQKVADVPIAGRTWRWNAVNRAEQLKEVDEWSH